MIVACGASPGRIGAVEPCIVKDDASQVAAMKRTFEAGAVSHDRRKLTVNLK